MRILTVACLAVGAWLGWQAYPAQAKPKDTPVTLYGEVDERTATIAVAQIQAANKLHTNAPILMFIDSPGGSVLAGNRIVDAMQSSRRPIYTVDVEFAASMAAYIWSFGEQRYMLPRAIVMFHDANMGSDGEMDHLESRLTVFHAVMLSYEARIAMISGLSINEVEQREHVEWWLLPKEAMEQHLATGVIRMSEYPQPGVKP